MNLRKLTPAPVTPIPASPTDYEAELNQEYTETLKRAKFVTLGDFKAAKAREIEHRLNVIMTEMKTRTESDELRGRLELLVKESEILERFAETTSVPSVQ